MFSFLRSVLAVFVGLLVFVLVIFIVIGTLVPGPSQRAQLPEEIVLYVDLRQDFVEQPSGDPFFLGAGPASILELVQALAQGEQDERVKGVFLRAGGWPVPLAQAQEIREALEAFKSQGKFVIAHTQGYFETGLGAYYATAVADEIWMQPNGLINTTGIAAQGMFVRGLMEKVGVEADLEQLYEYKGAADTFREEAFTEAQKETLGGLLRSAYGDAVADIAASRTLSVAELTSTLNDAPYLGSQAVAARLVDRLGYDDDAANAAFDRAGIFSEMIDWLDYYSVVGSPFTEGTAVALVIGEGAIHEGESAPPGFGGQPSMGGDTLARALRDATDDPEVEAILFRVNSPGGSVIASDQIWDAVKYAQGEGKPVVISMGDVAASGGYYVSMSADRIVANKTTVTGSIGVVSGKFVIGGALEKLGIKTDEIVVGGENTLLFAADQPFTDRQRQMLIDSMEETYLDFTKKVAEGRGLTEASLDQVARGRIWSGTDAKEQGLVDEIGGFRTALSAVREELELSADDPLALVAYPAPANPFDIVASYLGVSARTLQTFSQVAALLDHDVLAHLRDSVAAQSDAAPAARAEPLTLR